MRGGGTVVSLGGRRAFRNVVGGGVTVYAALREQGEAGSVRTVGGHSDRKKRCRGFSPQFD